MSRADDLEYIKRELGVDTETTPPENASNLMLKHRINTTSWVLTVLEEHYGQLWAETYREKIRHISCEHGFIGDCPYCKYGTE